MRRSINDGAAAPAKLVNHRPIAKAAHAAMIARRRRSRPERPSFVLIRSRDTILSLPLIHS